MHIGNKEKLMYVMIGYEAPYRVSCLIWNGVPGRARQIEFECNSKEEAYSKVKEVAAEYPNKSTVNGISIDDNCMIMIDYGDGQNE
jgi:hypothetical protein